MAFKLARATRETTPTTGTFDVTDVIELAGVTDADLQTFVESVGDTNQTIARLVTGDGAWIEFVCTVTDGDPATLTLDEIIASSNAGGPITLVGDTRVFGIISPDFSVLFDKLYGDDDATLIGRISGSWSGLAPGANGKFLSITLGQLSWEDAIVAGTTDQDWLHWDGTEWIADDTAYFRSGLIEDENSVSGTSFAVDNYVGAQDGTIVGPIMAQRQYGGTKATPTAILEDYIIAIWAGYGHDGTALGLGPVIQARATEDWNNTSHGSKLLFSHTLDGTTTPVFALELSSAGLSFEGNSFYNQAQSPYVFGFSVPLTTAFASSQVIGHHKAAAAFVIGANFSSAFGLANVAGGTANATASTVFAVERADAATPNTFAAIGTITFGAGGVAATFATTGGTSKSIAAGDVIRIVAPASPDSTFTGFYATIVGSRT